MPMNHILCRTCRNVKNSLRRNVQYLLANNFSENKNSFETLKTDPREHNLSDFGLIYKVDYESLFQKLYPRGVLKTLYLDQCKAFNEAPFLIRQPALEIINCLNNTDFETPVNKYLLFGEYGSGKSMTIAHIIHYAYMSDWLIIDIPVGKFVSTRYDVLESPLAEDFWNTPTQGVFWLKHFKEQNEALMNKLNLTISNEYKWNVHEINHEGDLLLNLVNHGIANPKYSCEVINFVCEEVKTLSKQNKVRTLVALDNFSLIFLPSSKLRGTFKKIIPTEKVNVVKGLKSLVKADWHNGAVLVSCYSPREYPNGSEYLPMHQLGTSGFEFLDPFIPIHVPKLNEKEFNSVLSYYRSKMWIPDFKNGDDELKILSAGNHLTLDEICTSL